MADDRQIAALARCREVLGERWFRLELCGPRWLLYFEVRVGSHATNRCIAHVDLDAALAMALQHIGEC
jgi:hypothetical protein